MQNDLRHRLRWAGGHFLVSSVVVLAVGMVILFVWYPVPYRVLSGGLSLLLLVAAVDVVLGPVCTFAVASAKKRLIALRRDVATIAVVQVMALIYGVWTVFQSRPVFLAFEIDRLRVVHAIDVDEGLLAQSKPEFRPLPVFGPRLVAVRPFVSSAEKMEVTMAALQGIDIGARADLWVGYESQAPAILSSAKPVAELLRSKSADRAIIENALRSIELNHTEARFLPVVGRRVFWTAILSPEDARPLVFLPVDPY